MNHDRDVQFRCKRIQPLHSGPAAATCDLISPNPMAPFFAAMRSRSIASGCVSRRRKSHETSGMSATACLARSSAFAPVEQDGLRHAGPVQMQDVSLHCRAGMKMNIQHGRAPLAPAAGCPLARDAAAMTATVCRN